MMMMTSAVDLRKVHVALSWLGEHNHFYKDVPSYSLSDIEKMSETTTTRHQC